MSSESQDPDLRKIWPRLIGYHPTSARASVLLAVLVLLLPNLALGLFAKWAGLYRPLVNVDYAILGAALLVLRAPVIGLLGVALLICDLLVLLSPAFYFTRESLGSAVLWKAFWLWKGTIRYSGLAVVGACAVLIEFLAAKLEFSRKVRVIGAVSVLSLGVGTCILDAFNGSAGPLTNRRSALFLPINIAFSPVFCVWEAYKKLPQQTNTPLDPQATATGRAWKRLLVNARLDQASLAEKGGSASVDNSPLASNPDGTLPTNFVFVMVESLGCLTSDPGRKQLFHPLLQRTNDYDIDVGSVSSFGSTVAGEIRELLWQRTANLKVEKPPEFSLPGALRDLGYQTVAFHGFYGTMFARQEWYPRIGFARRCFLEDMTRDNPAIPVAGTLFRGAYDSYVTSLVAGELEKSKTDKQKRFLYLLTLDSHLPVDSGRLGNHRALKFLHSLPASIQSHELLLWSAINGIDALAAKAAGMNTDLLLVGDHPPPFLEPALKAHYIPNQVPYILLRHRSSD